jgi:archaellum component FlaC
MSGEKDTIVNIRQSEYNRMMNTCNRMDNFDNSLSARLNDMSHNLRRDLNGRFESVNNRFSSIDRHISGLSDDMQRIESEQNRKIQEHARRFQQGISALSQEMSDQRREYHHLIQQQSESFKRALQAQQQELESQISQIRDSIQQKEADERQIASQWLSDTNAYLNMIHSDYRHAKFKPGELERLQSEIELCQGNFNQANYQAAIATSQQTFLRASQLRMALEQMEMEWEAHLEAAKCNATEVLAACDVQEACNFTFDTDEGAEEIAGEIDFWTKGALTEIRNLAKEELKQLNSPNDLSLDALKASMGKSETWRNECLNLSDQAKNAIIASQLRNNIGQTIEDALQEAGWEVTEAVYAGDDFRSSVHVKLKNLPGDEIVTIITPEPGPENTIQNKVNISFFDRSTNDESFRQNRLKSIMDMFQNQGLECSPARCKPGTENQPCQDISKLDLKAVQLNRKKSLQP